MTNENIQKQIAIISMRIQNINLALNDLIGDFNALTKAYADEISELKNSTLKANPKETPKTK
jgi:hypothetical protein